MKNIPFLTYILFCFFLLLFSIPSQAIIATSAEVAKEQKTTLKPKRKLERLRKKLSKKMAKVKQKQKRTKREEIDKKANRALGLGILTLLFGIGQFFFIGMPAFFGFLAVTLLFAVFSFISSYNVLLEIKRSPNPEQYRKSQKRAKSATPFWVVGLVTAVLHSYVFGSFFLSFL